MRTNTERHAVLLHLLESWFEQIDAGESPNPAEHCREHPLLLKDFERLLDRDETVERALEAKPVKETDRDVEALRLGEYEIVSTLGEGGAGRVYLARDLTLSRFVALKVVKTPAGLKDLERERIRREALIAAALDHPGIVPVYGIGHDGDRAWIAMKWLSGPSLDRLELPMDAKEAARIGAVVGRALHSAHEAGIIHRDVKPGNILMDDDAPFVVDFGLARMTTTTRTTLDGCVAGTLFYMSPEQLRSGTGPVHLDPRTDVYSLGATLYELVAGHPPFRGEFPDEVARRILLSEPAVPRNCPRDLSVILRKALEKDREHRYSTAVELASDLERFLEGRPIHARPAGIFNRALKLVKRHPRVASAALVLGLAGAVLAVRALGQHRDDQAALQRECSEVRRALKEQRLLLAEALYRPLEQRYSEEPEVKDLGLSLKSLLAIEDLLDELQDRRDGQNRAEILRVAHEIEMDASIPTENRAASRLVCAAAYVIEGDLVGYRRLAQDLKNCRAQAALEFAATAASKPWDLQSSASDPLDHLLTALALQHVEAPRELRRTEIALGLSRYEMNFRLRFQEGLLLLEDSQTAREAYRVFEGLEREERYPRVVRRALLRQSLAMGDLDRVASHLARLLEEYPRSRWRLADAWIAGEALHLLQQTETEVEFLNWAESVWPEDDYLLALKARSAAKRGEFAAAIRDLGRAVQCARRTGAKERFQLERLIVQRDSVDACVSPALMLPSTADRARLRAISEEAELLAKEASEPEVKDGARLVVFRAQCALMVMERALGLLESAESRHSQPEVFERALLAYTHYQLELRLANSGLDAEQERALEALNDEYGAAIPRAGRAARALERILSDKQSAAMIGSHQHVHGWFLVAVLFFAAGHDEASEKAMAEFRRLNRSKEDDWRDGYLANLSAALLARRRG